MDFNNRTYFYRPGTSSLRLINTIFISGFLLMVSNLGAYEIKGRVTSADWETAQLADSTFKFTTRVTKFGFLTSEVDGYVKDFEYTADYDPKKKKISKMVIRFPVISMDANGRQQNGRLHRYCLDSDNHPVLVIKIINSLPLNRIHTHPLKGVATIRGKDKDFSINVATRTQNNVMLIEGQGVWGFSEMGIPDPSILIASVFPEISISIKLQINLKKNP